MNWNHLAQPGFVAPCERVASLQHQGPHTGNGTGTYVNGWNQGEGVGARAGSWIGHFVNDYFVRFSDPYDPYFSHIPTPIVEGDFLTQGLQGCGCVDGARISG